MTFDRRTVDLRTDLANSTVARHAAEQQLHRIDPTPTKEN